MAEKKDKHDDLLREIRERFASYTQYWAENYKQGDLDMDCLSAEFGPWPKKDVTERQRAGRPIVHMDITSQFNRRISNQARMNPRGIVITPVGADANDETATMREDRIRQIDYESLAAQIRQNAVDTAVNRGIGYYMVTTDWKGDTLEQQINTRMLPNPKSVLLDPFAKKPDWSDMKAAFVIDRYEWPKYKGEYEDARIQMFDGEYLKTDNMSFSINEESFSWMSENAIQVCEYWRVEIEKKRMLLLVETPEGPTQIFLDELEGAKLKGDMLSFPDGREAKVLRQREIESPIVMQYITNGLEILKERKWVGTTIPIIMVTGLRKYENNKLVIESATRKMRAGQLTYDYIWTNIQETYGLIPKPHFQAAVGQTEDFPEYDDANRNPSAVLRHHVKTEESGDTPLNAPEFVTYEPNIAGMVMGLRECIIAVQQAAGMFAIQNQDRSKTSGKAQQELNQTQDVGNYHFGDNLDLAVQYEGKIKNEILRHVEDTEAIRGFRKADDKYEQRQVKALRDQKGELVEHSYGKGRDHGVIVKAGPSTDSQYDKASDFLDLLAGNEQFAAIVMPEIIAMKRLGAKGDQLAEMFEKLRKKLFPEIAPKEEGEEQAPEIPPEVQQKLAEGEQLMQMVQALTEKVKEQNAEAQAKSAELEAKIQMNQADNATKLAIADMNAKVKQTEEQTALFMQKMDQMLELTMQRRQAEQSAVAQGTQLQHETEQAERAAQQAREAAALTPQA